MQVQNAVRLIKIEILHIFTLCMKNVYPRKWAQDRVGTRSATAPSCSVWIPSSHEMIAPFFLGWPMHETEYSIRSSPLTFRSNILWELELLPADCEFSSVVWSSHEHSQDGRTVVEYLQNLVPVPPSNKYGIPGNAQSNEWCIIVSIIYECKAEGHRYS